VRGRFVQSRVIVFSVPGKFCAMKRGSQTGDVIGGRRARERTPPPDQRFADGTSWQEIGPDFFQPSRKSHVRGWYTTSGS
jgi:hypothetical protein